MSLKHYLSLGLLLLIAALSGCGTSNSYVMTPSPSTSNVASIRVRSVLAQTVVPAAVDEMRFTGLDAQGRPVYGPETRAKAADIVLQNVPLTVVRLQIEYLDNDSLVGIGSTALNLQPGQQVVLTNPEFEDLVNDLLTIAVSPPQTSIARGLSQTFVATARFEDGTETDVSLLVAWTSAQPEVASVSTSGVATSLRTGQTTISATLEGIVGNAQLTVETASVVSLVIAPANPTVPSGATAALTASANLSDGTTATADTVSWSSSAPSVATVDPLTGVVTSLSPGQTTITVRAGAISATTMVTVTDAALTRLTVAPATTDVAFGSSVQFSATGTYTDGSQRPLTSAVRWASSNTTALPITATGLATGQSPATGITITASLHTVEGLASATVTALPAPPTPSIVSIDVTPDGLSVGTGVSRQFSAVATFSNGATQNVTATVTWNSATSAVATVNSAGIVNGLTVGTSVIRATAPNGVFGEETVTVTPTDLALQSFETVPATPDWSYTGTPLLVSGNSNPTADPPNSPLAIDGTQAWDLTQNSGGLPLQFANITIPPSAIQAKLSFRLAAMNLTTSSGGPDNLDYVLVAVSTDGGNTFYPRLRIRGAIVDESSWPYSATGVASLNYLPQVEQTFQPTNSGPQTTQGYSTGEIIFDNPVPTHVAVRITMRSSSSADTWLLDDIRLTATY